MIARMLRKMLNSSRNKVKLFFSSLTLCSTLNAHVSVKQIATSLKLGITGATEGFIGLVGFVGLQKPAWRLRTNTYLDKDEERRAPHVALKKSLLMFGFLIDRQPTL